MKFAVAVVEDVCRESASGGVLLVLPVCTALCVIAEKPPCFWFTLVMPQPMKGRDNSVTTKNTTLIASNRQNKLNCDVLPLCVF